MIHIPIKLLHIPRSSYVASRPGNGLKAERAGDWSVNLHILFLMDTKSCLPSKRLPRHLTYRRFHGSFPLLQRFRMDYKLPDCPFPCPWQMLFRLHMQPAWIIPDLSCMTHLNYLCFRRLGMANLWLEFLELESTNEKQRKRKRSHECSRVDDISYIAVVKQLRRTQLPQGVDNEQRKWQNWIFSCWWYVVFNRETELATICSISGNSGTWPRLPVGCMSEILPILYQFEIPCPPSHR